MAQSVNQLSIPKTMRALTVAAYGKPSTYNIATIPTPQIRQPDEVLIKVHATSVNPIDITIADGTLKMASNDTFPLVLGYDAAGVVVDVGSDVDSLKVGDKVFTRVANHLRGTMAEYCLSLVTDTAIKPASISFVDSASIPLVGLTVLQAIRRAEAELDGGLRGKTVYVPGGLSGTGSVAVQLLRNVFGAKKVITTLSPGKIDRAKELWKDGEGEIDYLDYTKNDVNAAIGDGIVDFMLDTMGGAMDSLPVMRHGGVIVTISKTPSGNELKTKFKSAPWLLVVVLDLLDGLNRWRASRHGVKYSYMWMNPDAKGLQDLGRWVVDGKVNPLVGKTARLYDLEGVRKGFEEVQRGKGGVGKFVIEII